MLEQMAPNRWDYCGSKDIKTINSNANCMKNNLEIVLKYINENWPEKLKCNIFFNFLAKVLQFATIWL